MEGVIEGERLCVGVLCVWCGGPSEKLAEGSYSFRLSKPGPLIHPGSLAVSQHLGPDHLPLRPSLPTLAFPLHRRHPALSPLPNISLSLSFIILIPSPRTRFTPKL